MTSKEAIERVKTVPEYCGGNSIYKRYDNSYIPFMRDIELIEKDLEVLELLKKRCAEGKDTYGEGTWGWVEFDLGDYDKSEFDYEEVQKEIEMIREWLLR